MSRKAHTFDPSVDQLPDRLPLFPLPGVLLLPGGHLPLNIYEPRYLNMVDAALSGSRLIGMVQPAIPEGPEAEEEDARFEIEDSEDIDFESESGGAQSDPGSAPVYRTGCTGRIVSFSETDDGRYLITLKGLLRFRVLEELPLTNGYRQVKPDYGPFLDDLEPCGVNFDRERLLEALSYYFDQQGIEADWDAIQDASNERLITSLAMVCPFSAAEKQALLEARHPSDRAETMTAILEMSVLGTGSGRSQTGSRH